MSVGGICVVLVVLVDVLRFFLGFPPDCDPDGTRKLPPTILVPEVKRVLGSGRVLVVLQLIQVIFGLRITCTGQFQGLNKCEQKLLRKHRQKT